jgi:uncharacterized protein YecT (DUF1311 family)
MHWLLRFDTKMKPCPGILFLLLLVSPVLEASDKELLRKEASLNAALTQTDMNLRSGEIAECLDRKLVRLEERIKKDLDKDALALFEEASLKWRAYRDAQINSEGDVYRGGSMRPLIQSLAFIRLTNDRLSTLQKMNPEGKYKAD